MQCLPSSSQIKPCIDDISACWPSDLPLLPCGRAFSQCLPKIGELECSAASRSRSQHLFCRLCSLHTSRKRFRSECGRAFGISDEELGLPQLPCQLGPTGYCSAVAAFLSGNCTLSGTGLLHPERRGGNVQTGKMPSVRFSLEGVLAIVLLTLTSLFCEVPP